jgi:diaminopimelate epimerase
MRLWKAHAYGNDFLYVERRETGGRSIVELAKLACEVCDRHAGIGSDGLIVFELTPAGASMVLLNADGSRAEVSGNGVRALAALLLRGDERDGAAITIRTDAGDKALTRLGGPGGRQVFKAAMGHPTDVRQQRMSLGEESIDTVVLAIGNPHCVILGSLPDRARFERIGAALERHSAFPSGTNVEFVEVEQPDRIRILIWERGVGPTQSSGTGSCASAVAAARFGGAARDVEVVAPGGSQRVEWREAGVHLTGWAEVLCKCDWLAS